MELKVGKYRGKGFINTIVIKYIMERTIICDYFCKGGTKVSFNSFPKGEVEQDIKDYNLKYVEDSWE